MKYYQHLKKINGVNEGSRWELFNLTIRYNLRFFLSRPPLMSMYGKNRYKKLKKLFYTVLVGDYDHLNEILVKLPNWEYVCYTDNPELTSESWDIRLLENELGLDPIRLSRHYKINNHLIDEPYDLSVYTDANIRIRGNLDTYLAHALAPGEAFSILLHPFLFSLKEELELCVDGKKDNTALLRAQYDHYLAEGYHDQFPHVNARMMIRKSGDVTVRRLMEAWFDQLQNWSKRDQMGFNYALSLFPQVKPAYIPYWIFRSYFKKMDHH